MGGADSECPIKGTAEFSAAVLRQKFGAGMTVRKYQHSDLVFLQGDTADAVFYIQSGTLTTTLDS
jgi:CRP-like cAMP-binding protein